MGYQPTPQQALKLAALNKFKKVQPPAKELTAGTIVKTETGHGTLLYTLGSYGIVRIHIPDDAGIWQPTDRIKPLALSTLTPIDDFPDAKESLGHAVASVLRHCR